MQSKLEGILIFLTIALITGFFLLSSNSTNDPKLLENGILRFNRKLTYPGYNLYNSMTKPIAYLMDLEGQVVHKWAGKNVKIQNWHHIEPVIDGSIIAIATGQGLVKINWGNQKEWFTPGGFHHDLDILSGRTIYALMRKGRNIPYKNTKLQVLDDLIGILNSNGKIIKTYSLYNIFKDYITEKKLEKIEKYLKKATPRTLRTDTPSDIFHTNSIEVLRKDVPGLGKRGNILLSIRQLNLIALVDIDEEKVIWSWGQDELEHQHHASVLENGNILLLDNGIRRNYSRVIEINSTTKKIVSEFKGNSHIKKFYTDQRGGAQRLPNGNTLITIAQRGKVIEVTPKNKIVWSYLKPGMTKDSKKKRLLYRMTRIGIGDDFLNKLEIN